MNRHRCEKGRALHADSDDVRISVELLVGPHEMVELTAARTLMLLLRELEADRVPVRLAQVALAGALCRGGPPS